MTGARSWMFCLVWLTGALAANIGCSSHTTNGMDAGADAGADGAIDQPADQGVTGLGGHRLDGAPPPDTAGAPPDGYSFPDPPAMSCAGTGGTAGGCDFPEPNCANSAPARCDTAGRCTGGTAIVYYDNPRCVDGHCVWDKRYYDCGPARFCSQGGCLTNATAVP